MNNESRVIELVKGPASDDLMRRILLQWYRSSRSRLMNVLEWVVTAFFVLASVFFMTQGMDAFAWVSIAGLIVCAFLLFGYVPMLARAAQKIAKPSPSYNEVKHYRFEPGAFAFWYGAEKPVEGSLGVFDEVRLTRDAVLFIGGGRLALWLAREDLSAAQTELLLDLLREAGVRVTTWR